MERIGEVPPHLINTSVRAKEVLVGTKNTSLVVEVADQEAVFEVLFRPEDGVRLTLDIRIPKPQELYRDAAFHLVDQNLGWKVSAPVVPCELEGFGKGVMRPYWREVKPFEAYNLKPAAMTDQFWTRLAILDFICGVVDRNSRDILLVRGERLVAVDSGLSFVEGVDFVYHHSVVRDALKGIPIPRDLLISLQTVDGDLLKKNLNGIVKTQEANSFFERLELLCTQKVVL